MKRLMFGRDSEDEIWLGFVLELVIWTQPSGPLCLWQCFYCSPITNLVRSTEVSEVTWKLLGVSLFSRLPHSPMQLLLDPLKVHQRLDWLIWKVKHGDSFKILTKLELQNLDITSDSKIGPNFTNWFGLAKFYKILAKSGCVTFWEVLWFHILRSRQSNLNKKSDGVT